MYTFRYSSLVSAGLKAHLLVSMRQICVTFVTAAFARINHFITIRTPPLLRNVWVRTAMLIGYAPPSTHVRAPRAAARRAVGAWLTDDASRRRTAGAAAARRGAAWTQDRRWDGTVAARPLGPGGPCRAWRVGAGEDTGLARGWPRRDPYFVDPYFLTRPDSSF